jgi:hypothetical protein
MNVHDKGTIIVVEVHKFHLVCLVLLDPLVHFLFDLLLLLFSLLSVMRKIVKCQLALLVLPVRICDIDCILSDVQTLVNFFVH